MTVMFVLWWAVAYSLACCGVLLWCLLLLSVTCRVLWYVCVWRAVVWVSCGALWSLVVFRCVCEVICRLLWRSEIFVECAADESILNLLADIFRGRCFLIFSTTRNGTNYTAMTLSP